MTYLGIDGGGTKTTFLVTDDEDKEIRRLQTGPSNWLSVGKETAAASIRAGAAQLAELKPDVVCGGFAGAGRPEGLAFYKSVLEPLFPQSKVRIESDAFIAYAGAIGLAPGVLLIAGTGSIAIGRKNDGTMIRVGGWGPHFGDDGGGYWIGREIVRAALQSFDSQKRADFETRISRKLGIQAITDVVSGWGAGTIGVPEIAGLVPEVMTLWPHEPATRILKSAAEHLRWLVETAVQRVAFPNCPVCASGSIALHPVMRQLMQISFAEPIAPAECGAVMLARQAAALPR
jgi:N-acetylglucosamine kinase-like BadF-type ATPase